MHEKLFGEYKGSYAQLMDSLCRHEISKRAGIIHALAGELPWLYPLPGEANSHAGHAIYMNAARVASSLASIPAIQRNAASPRDFKRMVPELVVIESQLEAHQG